MLFYYQIVTCLPVTCAAAAADVGLLVDATAYVFQLKILQRRDHEWTSQTKNSQRGYDLERSVLVSGKRLGRVPKTGKSCQS